MQGMRANCLTVQIVYAIAGPTASSPGETVAFGSRRQDRVLAIDLARHLLAARRQALARRRSVTPVTQLL